jgi:hypothetical protein
MFQMSACAHKNGHPMYGTRVGRSCGDINADGSWDMFDCSSHANDIDVNPTSLACAADPCTGTECCTVVVGGALCGLRVDVIVL